jgi:exopolysaccharide production protein ExoZ
MLRNLQALRGVACLLVVWLHVAATESGMHGLRTPLFHAGWWFGAAGVDLFFVLSGFVITYTHWTQRGRPAAVPGYLFRRAWRI